MAPERCQIQVSLQAFGGDVNLIGIVCSGQMKLVKFWRMADVILERKFYCILLENWGSKEETKREMKMYGAYAAVCSLSSGMGKAGYQKSERQLPGTEGSWPSE